MHVVVEVLDLPVEIQVRTAAQHEWAEYFERLADVWGRAIRYEDGAPDVERLLSNTSFELADAIRPELEAVGLSMVDHALVLSDVIDFQEGQAGQRLGAEADRLDVVVARQLMIVRDLATAFEPIFGRLG